MRYRSRLLAFLIGIVVTTGVAAGASAQEPLSFNIPPQPLSSALLQYSEVTNLELLVDARLTSGRESPGVSGSYSPEQALNALLAGTGLTYRFTSGGAVTLIEAPAMPAGPRTTPAEGSSASPSHADGTTEKPIKVQEVVIKEARERDDTRDYVAEEASTATRTPTPIRDIPQSIAVVTRKLMDDQKVIRLEQAVRNVSGIFQNIADRQDFFLCRGFLCGYFKNGLRNDNVTQVRIYRETANLQRLEVLKGPPSVLYGRSEPGGILNLITKQPLPESYYAFDTIFGSYSLYRPTIDLSGPLNESKTFLYRFNGAYENSESFRDFVRGQRYFAAPVFTWKMSHNTTLTLEGEYLRDQRTHDRGVVAIGDRPAAIPISRYLGEPFSVNKFEEGRASAYLTHRFNETWSVLSAFRADLANEEDLRIDPRNLLADNRTLTRRLNRGPQSSSSFIWRNDVIGRFTTGSVGHEVLTGLELAKEHQDARLAIANFTSIDIFNPVYGAALLDVAPNFFQEIDLQTVSPFVQDHITLRDNLKVLAGVRYDIVKQKNTSNGVEIVQEDQAVSPRIGLVYQPFQPISLYATVTRSFRPQSGLSFNGSAFKPETGTLYEAGVKTDMAPSRLSSTLAFYRIVKENVLTPDPTNLGFSVQTGAQRSQGIEFDITANLTPEWNVIATYAYTDARLTSDNTFPVGNRLMNVPKHAGSLWTTYFIQRGVLQGFGVGAGLFAVGERVGDLHNTFELPGYVRTDMALYYRKANVFTRTNLTAQLNIQNLFDVQYYDGAFARTFITPGAPLTFLGSIKLEFY
jgi:iron complex outermembrane recepter protein